MQDFEKVLNQYVELVNAQIRKKRVLIDYPELADDVAAKRAEIRNDITRNKSPTDRLSATIVRRRGTFEGFL